MGWNMVASVVCNISLFDDRFYSVGVKASGLGC